MLPEAPVTRIVSPCRPCAKTMPVIPKKIRGLSIAAVPMSSLIFPAGFVFKKIIPPSLWVCVSFQRNNSLESLRFRM
jgi:hypothetical protein